MDRGRSGILRIVDRRFDSKNKSTVNRQRFLRRFKGQIREAVTNVINQRGVRDIDSGEKISIPARDISEPQFQHGRGGVWRRTLPGNDRFHSGDEIDRPDGGGGGSGSGKASNEGEGMDEFAFTLSREEFLELFFEDLALPNLVKTQLARIDEYQRIRAGYTQTGVPANISIPRSMRGAAGRRIAFSAVHARRLQELKAQLEDAVVRFGEESEEAREIRREIAKLRTRIEAIPFIDSIDLRYNNRVRIPRPSTQAVMFCVMDVSGSMDEEKKNIAKRFFMLLYLFLTRTYDHIELVFIRHHTQAVEVGEEDFFTSRETGGTVVSSALQLMHKIIADRYQSSVWNIYCAQASDGENWDGDSPQCRALLGENILPLVQYFAYIEISTVDPQNLWLEYEQLRDQFKGRFAMQQIRDLTDIYPVFRELFRKKLA
ncbi:YeaH/YhbH family protein [Imbroritus primus]|uniref:YeaH/YhbH family protein n=1 Tax=Imbroritus primus TaxID=3058603 RepID=UPI0002696D38